MELIGENARRVRFALAGGKRSDLPGNLHPAQSWACSLSPTGLRACQPPPDEGGSCQDQSEKEKHPAVSEARRWFPIRPLKEL